MSEGWGRAAAGVTESLSSEGRQETMSLGNKKQMTNFFFLNIIIKGTVSRDFTKIARVLGVGNFFVTSDGFKICHCLLILS